MIGAQGEEKATRKLPLLPAGGLVALVLAVLLCGVCTGRSWAYFPSDATSDASTRAVLSSTWTEIAPDASDTALLDTILAAEVTPSPIPSPVVVRASGPPPVVVTSPRELMIPRIGVDAPIVPVDLTGDGSMGVPPGPWSVGWWDRGFLPGQLGSAVIDGHVDYVKVGPAVFWNLGQLQPGDQIQVGMPGNRTLTFVVERSAVYAADDQSPIDAIFGPSDVPRLNLITCTGVFDPASRSYNRRLVVYAKLASS